MPRQVNATPPANPSESDAGMQGWRDASDAELPSCRAGKIAMGASPGTGTDSAEFQIYSNINSFEAGSGWAGQ